MTAFEIRTPTPLMQEAISSRALRGRRLSRCDGAKMVITVRSGSASLSTVMGPWLKWVAFLITTSSGAQYSTKSSSLSATLFRRLSDSLRPLMSVSQNLFRAMPSSDTDSSAFWTSKSSPFSTHAVTRNWPGKSGTSMVRVDSVGCSSLSVLMSAVTQASAGTSSRSLSTAGTGGSAVFAELTAILRLRTAAGARCGLPKRWCNGLCSG
mmetsp:Transcript_11651/g.34989  ORF Transcript_11651/g.34989 Transcript_11651/m.34989 type:complete len:209 (+) Transcript_11651:796-1422(+)